MKLADYPDVQDAAARYVYATERIKAIDALKSTYSDNLRAFTAGADVAMTREGAIIKIVHRPASVSATPSISWKALSTARPDIADRYMTRKARSIRVVGITPRLPVDPWPETSDDKLTRISELNAERRGLVKDKDAAKEVILALSADPVSATFAEGVKISLLDGSRAVDVKLLAREHPEVVATLATYRKTAAYSYVARGTESDLDNNSCD